jgi:chromatin remodeling complex protein RSC6
VVSGRINSLLEKKEKQKKKETTREKRGKKETRAMKDFKNLLKKNGWSGGDETGIKWKSG